jgi:hypothetical protein
MVTHSQAAAEMADSTLILDKNGLHFKNIVNQPDQRIS